MEFNWVLQKKLRVFIVVNLIFLSFGIINNIFLKNFFLPWSSHIILPSIINNITGLLNQDFFTSSYNNTPQKNFINILSWFLSKDHETALALFSLFVIYVDSLIVTTQLFLVTAIFSSIINSSKKDKSSFNFEFLFLSICFTYKLINIFQFLINYFFSENNSYLVGIYNNFSRATFFGLTIGGWNFDNFQATRGISLVISLMTIMIPLLIDSYKLRIKKSFLFLLLIITFFANFSATLIHPISPAAVILIILIYLMIKRKSTFFNHWNKILILNIISYIAGIFILMNSFPQEEISNLDLYDIYVKLRHSHHYVPSYYLNYKIFKFTMLYSAVLLTLIFTFNKIIFKNVFLQRILIYSISSAFCLNLIQYVFVEKLKIKAFINFGFSSLSYVYNIFYIVLILYFIYLLILKYTITPNYENQLNKLKFLFNNLIQKRIFYFLIFFVISISIICVKSNYLKIESSLTRGVSLFIAKTYDDNSEFIISDSLNDKLMYPREVGGINIFYDFKYYPYATESILKWRDRKFAIDGLKQCIESNSKTCSIKSKNKIFYITDKFETKFTLNNKSLFHSDKRIFIQEVNTNF